MQPNFDEANSSLESNSRTKTIVESNPRSNRLSIKHLMVWLAGVAVGITAGQHLERSHYAAESAISIANGQEPRTAEPMKMAEIVVAVGFGTGISLGILAVMGGPGFWQDPARIGITVFGVMGIIGFLTQLSTTTYVAHTGSRLIGQAGYFFSVISQCTSSGLWLFVHSRRGSKSGGIGFSLGGAWPCLLCLD